MSDEVPYDHPGRVAQRQRIAELEDMLEPAHPELQRYAIAHVERERAMAQAEAAEEVMARELSAVRRRLREYGMPIVVTLLTGARYKLSRRGLYGVDIKPMDKA
jgi:DNA-binding phage protein